jgi:hypothetical protein
LYNYTKYLKVFEYKHWYLETIRRHTLDKNDLIQKIKILQRDVVQ